MVTFPEEINPQKGLLLRFDYDPRAYQYLEFFKVINTLTHKFLPIDLAFGSYNDLMKFLSDKGIVYQEIQVDSIYSRLSKIITVVDTRKIFNVAEDTTKYLLNYRYYSINEVADMLSMSRVTIYKLVNDQSLKAVRINGQFRINHLDLMNFIHYENKR
jgi:excisionase family DNA binding protein